MLTTWGVERVLWGSDIITDRNPSALEQARIAWPLTETEWQKMAASDGAAFLARTGTQLLVVQPILRSPPAPRIRDASHRIGE